jgi:hypothetical protein
MSDSDQSSNFRDHISDGYAASTLKAYGFPMAEKKKNRIHNWMSPSSRHRKQQARQAAQVSDKEGSWVNRVESMGVGEDIEGRDVDRRKERIDMWEMERGRLREEGPFENAENDFHPQNSGTATGFVESGQYEDAVPMELEEDGQYEDTVPMELEEDDSEDIRGSPNNPRALYNPDALTADLIDSDRQAAQWIEDHFNGNGGRGQALLYDPSAPLIDYAIEGYDGENMDGIE